MEGSEALREVQSRQEPARHGNVDEGHPCAFNQALRVVYANPKIVTHRRKSYMGSEQAFQLAP
nr:hypothetical protein [Mesorhizobium sp.]